jgi:hypothetical protein
VSLEDAGNKKFCPIMLKTSYQCLGNMGGIGLSRFLGKIVGMAWSMSSETKSYRGVIEKPSEEEKSQRWKERVHIHNLRY